MREVLAYVISAFAHIAVLGYCAIILDQAPQVLSIETGRASPELAASIAAKPETAEMAFDVQSEVRDRSEPLPELEPNKTEIARREPQPELEQRKLEPSDVIAYKPPPSTTVQKRLPDEQPPQIEPKKLPPKRMDEPDVPIADVAMVTVSSMPSRASAGVEDDKLPQKAATNSAPIYPADALQYGWEGDVTLLLTISAEGKVTAASVLVSSGRASLDQSALTAARNWRFLPATRAGAAVEFQGQYRVHFSLANR